MNKPTDKPTKHHASLSDSDRADIAIACRSHAAAHKAEAAREGTSEIVSVACNAAVRRYEELAKKVAGE